MKKNIVEVNRLLTKVLITKWKKQEIKKCKKTHINKKTENKFSEK